jgi:hypothetical protein
MFLSGIAVADDEEAALPDIPRHRVTMENLTAVRYNPLGLQEYFTVSYRLRLMDSDSVLFRDTYVAIGPTIVLSPAFAKGGVALKVVPIAMVELSAVYRYQYFFGNFNHVTSFDDPSDDWSDTALDADETEEAMGGHMVVLQARLQAKAGPVAIRNTARFEYYDMPLPDGSVGYYDQTPDMLVANDGWTLVNDADVIYLWGASAKLKTGVRYTGTLPWYGDGGGPEGNASHRIGPLISYMFYEKPGAAFDKPTLILLSQWHVQHRFRTGEDVSAAIPYLALAFTFEGDLLPWRE